MEVGSAVVDSVADSGEVAEAVDRSAVSEAAVAVAGVAAVSGESDIPASGRRRTDMKRGLLVTLAVVAVLLIGIGGCLAGNYNKLVTSKASVSQQWAQVDNQLQRRNDLIGNLVETVKGT